MSTLQVRADISPSVHPDFLSPQAKTLDKEDTLGSVSIGLAREAMTTLYETLGRMADAEKAWRDANPSPPSKNYPNRVRKPLPREVLDAADAAFNRAAATVDARMKMLAKHRETLAERVDAALKVPATSANLANAQEVRAYLRSVAPSKRTTVIHDAIKSKDVATVAAAFGAQPFLSGLEPETVKTMRDLAAKAFAPGDYAQLGALDETIERIRQASEIFVGRFAKIRDGGSKREHDAREATAALAAGGAK